MSTVLNPVFNYMGLLLAGQIVYHGPKEHVLEFFEGLGFHLPHRKGIADFLQASIFHSLLPS